MHAAARRALIERHQLFAFLKTPQRRGQRAHVHRLRGDIEKMRQQAADFTVERADELGALRYREAEQPFRGQAEGVLLVHWRDVIEPVEVWDRLQIGFGFDQFLRAAMQEPDMRIDALDHLAVKLKDQAQHAVGRRMLRPEIHGEIAQRGFSRRLNRTIAIRCSQFAIRHSSSALPSRRREGRSPDLPTARGTRICGIPG
jgi:hypothetical protein